MVKKIFNEKTILNYKNNKDELDRAIAELKQENIDLKRMVHVLNDKMLKCKKKISRNANEIIELSKLSKGLSIVQKEMNKRKKDKGIK